VVVAAAAAVAVVMVVVIMMMKTSVESINIYYIYMAPYLRRLPLNFQPTSSITTSFRKISVKQQQRPS
jgi:hypothetical protein